VVVPVPPKYPLAVFNGFKLVQLVPFQDSVAAVIGGVSVPPKAKAAVFVPAAAALILATFKSLTTV